MRINDALLRDSLEELFLSLSRNLDITKTQHENLVKSYEAVGRCLDGDTTLSTYHPMITPQGSLRLGTIIQPINDDDDLDVDLVFRLIGKSPCWTQYDIKLLVGQRLKNNATYRDMLDEEGRRCWTLLYRQDSDNVKERYHMDILPCVADAGHVERLRMMEASAFRSNEVDRISIRITDKERSDYRTETNKNLWLKSNPDGYAIWFASRCKTTRDTRELIMESIMPIGKYVATKTNLQRIVQILKRHRDMMFNGDEDKPISIIITTLAAKAYQGESSLYEGLSNVIDRMESHIETKGGIYIIANPVNAEENFADKWIAHPKRKENFFKWLRQLKADRLAIISQKGGELRESFARSFGKNTSDKVFQEQIQTFKKDASNGKLKLASTGVIGGIGKTLNAKNTFFGEK